jgi:hypothetical protein
VSDESQRESANLQCSNDLAMLHARGLQAGKAGILSQINQQNTKVIKTNACGVDAKNSTEELLVKRLCHIETRR